MNRLNLDLCASTALSSKRWQSPFGGIRCTPYDSDLVFDGSYSFMMVTGSRSKLDLLKGTVETALQHHSIEAGIAPAEAEWAFSINLIRGRADSDSECICRLNAEDEWDTDESGHPDFGLDEDGLQRKYGREHPAFLRSDWENAESNDDTHFGY